MKKLLVTLSLAIILPITFLFSACDPTSILNQNTPEGEKVQLSGVQSLNPTPSEPVAPERPSTNLPPIVEPTYDVDFYQIYKSAYDNGEFTGSYLEFIEKYFGVSTKESSSVQYATNIGLLSAVSVYSAFTTTFEDPLGNTQTQNYSSAGAGVIYTLNKEEGSAYIITNYHVVYDINSDTEDKISDDINVYLYGGEYAELAIPATYVGGSMVYDIAVLEVRESLTLVSSHARSADFANSDETPVGSTAIAIGNPEANGIAATQGIVCVDSEDIIMTTVDKVSEVQMRVMRIDTAVNSGNSGGGLYNCEGKLIGIVNAKKNNTEIENISYAIPSNIAKNVADNIIDNCANSENKQVLKCMLGVGITVASSSSVYDTETKTTRIKEEVLISTITVGSLADQVLSTGMIVTAISKGETRVEVDRTYKLVDFMLTGRVGDTITIEVVDNGEEKSFDITLTDSSITKIA